MFTNMLKIKTVVIACLAVCAVSLARADAPSEGSTPIEKTKNSGASKKTASKAPDFGPGVIEVSDYELNTFVFPYPVKKGIIFKSDAPVEGEPIYLANKTQAVIQFGKSKTPVQMVVPLANDDTLTIRVLPRPIPGVTHPINGAKKKLVTPAESKTPSASDAPRSGEDVELLKFTIMNGTPPNGFDIVSLPGITRFDKFSVIPLAAWSNGEKNLYVFSLVATKGQAAVVTPPQFYRQGITAVMINGGEVVDEKTSPQLFIIEEASDE